MTDQELIEALREIVVNYADHQSWRCTYRTRYGKCMCGLDEHLEKLGMEPVAVNDPESKD